MLKALQLTALLLFAVTMTAQKSKVFGTVSDSDTRESIIQATVIYKVKGSDNPQGVMTDFDGRYSVDLTYGTYIFEIRYLGYEPLTQEVKVDAPSKQLNFTIKPKVLKEAIIEADIAIERETPVAFSNIKPLQIQEELASQPLPMILNSTPGVYATQEGSDDNGPSITIRGFKQRNVSVMIDGIPVNDMENGGVFWNNWFGLDLVMRTMQVQRGLGHSKLALPAIGGTVNIMTQGIEARKNTMVKAEGGTTGMGRITFGHTSGLKEGGWGYTLAGSYKYDDGYVTQQSSQALFYYAKVQKSFGNHLLSVSAMGAPSWNNTRSYQQRIATFDKDLARSLFKGSDADYERMREYSTRYWTIANDDLLDNVYPTVADQQQALTDLNTEFGYDSKADFEDLMYQTDFIDTTRVIEKGRQYNVHWGQLGRNGEGQEPFYERQNQYHKPLFTFRHGWAVHDSLYIATSLYASIGRGGGTALSPGLGDGDFSEDGQINFQGFYDAHTTPDIFGIINPEAGWILRKTFNNHYWTGLLSTIEYTHDDHWSFSGGVDFRDYRGEKYSEVFDLLGAEYFLDITGDDNNLPERKFEGDRIQFHNRTYVRWGGIFGLAEYKDLRWTAFLNVSGVYQGYNRIDYYAPRDVQYNGVDYYQQLGYDDVFVLDEVSGEFTVAPTDNVYEIDGNQGTTYVIENDNGIAIDTLSNAILINQFDAETRTSTSDWKWIPGYTIKAGGNFKIDEWHSAFMNIGLLNRTPVLQNVIGFDNQFVKGTENEIINSIELGYGYSKYPLSFNVNLYYTDWNNRPLNDLLSIVVEDSQGVERRLRANIPAMSAVHRGIELDGAYQLTKNIALEGYISIGDWKWDSSEDELTLIDVETNRPFEDPDTNEPLIVEYDAKGVYVGDAPQSQYGFAVKFQKNGIYLKPRFTYFHRHYADFDPFSLNGENARRQSWEIPGYGLIDLHAGYTWNVKESQFDLRVSAFNVLNTLFIINAQNNDIFPFYLYQGDNGEYDDRLRYHFTESNFDAQSASVYMGYGARGNISLRVRF
ncbi:MAG: TonB-dependent receptor [Flavobacteriales bacterium]|nr:TonB-dependent receptor [Flavobacteriales bacterium]MDG1779567.1 TonB-dependent receptor [Flavobacteriales bacterium]